MKLKYMTNDNINMIKYNLDHYLPFFMEDDNCALLEHLGKNPLRDTKYNINEEIYLDISKDDPKLTDVNNVKQVYGKLKFLSCSQASDERIWAAMALGPFWKYVKYRWNVKDQCTTSKIMQHYFYGFGTRRSLIRHAIARLWWIGRLTYDENRSNPYELTGLVCENSRFITDILERNTSNNRMIARAFLEAILEVRQKGYTVNTENLRLLAKYLNLLGGIYILDCLPKETIHKKIYDAGLKFCHLASN